MIATIAASCVVLALPPSIPPAGAVPPSVVEVNPNTVTPAASLKYGGRIETLSIKPDNAMVVLGASELGGLWRSTDGGTTWGHIDNLPLTRMYDVHFALGDPNLVIATGDNDGASPNRGGIWRSTDAGGTWSRPATGVNGSSCSNPSPGAHWVDTVGSTPGSVSVFVATDCGISVSTDSGATWVQRFASGAFNARYWDVKARQVGPNIQVDACGDGGFTRSTNSGGAFSAYVGDSTRLFGAGAIAAAPCRIALAPNDANAVFISSFKRNTVAPACSSLLQLSSNANAGAPTWTDLNACGNNNRNGRWPFVVTHPDPANPATKFLAYFGNNTRTNVQTCTYGPTACGAGPWGVYDASHPHNGTDPTDVVFDPSSPSGCPVLVAGDGGVASPSDCSTSPGSFTMRNTSLNALDAINMAGTVYPGSHTSLYFGTQDNGIFVSTNDGTTYNRFAYDIYGLNADHAKAAAVPPSRVLWRDAAYSAIPNNHVNLANEDLSSNTFWSTAPPLPPGNDPSDNYSATQFGHDRYAFITPDIAPAPLPAPQPNWRMYVTTDAGGSWTQMGGNAPGAPIGNPQASGTAANPVFYVLLSVGAGTRLYKLSGPIGPGAAWTDVTGTLSNPTTFGVHPSNSQLLYVNDAGLNQVMKSSNGGTTWVLDAGLTSLVTRGGQFPFVAGGSQIAAFGFDGNSNTVTAGANNSGVFASTDGGTSWFSVSGAENLPRIAGFFFDERTGSVYFASGGRGMWKFALPTADLAITKSSAPNPVAAGNQLTVTLMVTNNGPADVPSVAVTDTLALGVTFESSDAGCIADSPPPGTRQTVTCDLGALLSGATRTVTIQTRVATTVPVGTVLTNTATVGGSVDTTPGNNAAMSSVTVDRDHTITTLTSSPNPSEFGMPVTFSATVSPDPPPGAAPPSGTVTFRIDGSSVASPSLDGASPGHASFTTSGLGPGAHTVVATYSGDANFYPSTSAPLTQTVICANNLTGNQGSLTLGPGSSWCLRGVNASGSITIQPGAAVAMDGTSALTGITSEGAKALRLCSVRVLNGPLTIRHSTGFVLVGDPDDDHCGGTSVGGPAVLDGNAGGVEVGSSSMRGLTVSATSGTGAFPEDDRAEIENNRVQGDLACPGNAPAATNGGRPNVVTGTRSGDCSAPGF